MRNLLYTIEHCYMVATLVCVGVSLALQGYVTRGENMGKGKKAVDAVTVADMPVNTPVALPTTGTAVVAVAKAMLAVAGMLPPVATVVKGNTLPNPLHVPHGASKRSMALAVYNAVTALGYDDTQARRLSSVLLVLTGVGYCHATGKVLVGEVHGTRGLVGYIKPQAAWWGTTSNTAKAVLVQAYANGIVQGCINDAQGDYAKALPMAESMMQRYIAVYGEETTNLD